jgi:2-deoxy-D-gluconate 3-dehydrogenase
MQLFDLSGKVAVVTGGNGGIGLGMAKGMAKCGAAIVVAGRNKEKSAQAVNELKALGVKANFIAVDVEQEASCRSLIEQAAKEMGRIDILVNNAGMNVRKRPEEYTTEEFVRVLNTNLISAFTLCQAAYPHMKKAGGGKIINIGSMMSLFGGPFHTPYGSSKGGIVQMGRSLAAAWAQDNIQINAVLPGWIDTELTRRAREHSKELHDNVLRRTPAARWGTPDDFEGIAAFLASPASDFVTGTAIPVCGGFSILGV